MRTKVAQFIVVCALVFAIGAHWAILQSVAWVGMTINYAHDSSFKEALAKTFDGKHPCKLCKAVAEGKKSEHKQTLLKVETKLDFFLAHNSLLLAPPLPFVLLPGEPDSALLRADPPPTPPPRAA